MFVELAGVTRSFDGVAAVDDVSLSIPEGEFFSVLGPSGCGKTTLLRMIGGFEPIDAGRIAIGGEDVTGRSARRRPTAMVFQNYALFPNMTVSANVGYGLRVARVEAAQRRRRVAAALDMVGMGPYGDRAVDALSGGQQQRVAVARALAVEPRLLLLDEPLSNLDLALRQSTRMELKQLQRQAGITSIYVTHDQGEALALSDRLAVMRQGRLVQVGTPRDVYERPATAFVATFLGGANIVRERAMIDGLLGTMPTGTVQPATGGSHVLAVRPEQLIPDLRGVSLPVHASTYLGTVQEILLGPTDAPLRAHCPADTEIGAFLAVRARKFAWVEDDLAPTAKTAPTAATGIPAH